MIRSRRKSQATPLLLPELSVSRKIRPALLRQLNERVVFETVRDHGPISRADLTRQSGITPPTASKVVAKLLRAGFLEEVNGAENDAAAKAGRPSKVYRLGTGSVQVLGAAMDVRRCAVLAAGLDGKIDPASVLEFSTPATYDDLIDALAERARTLMRRGSMETLGMGISTPGEVDMREQRVLLSPNLHVTDGRSPGRDLQRRLGIETVMFHETIGTCLAERANGAAKGLNDFVMIGVYEGFGVSIVSGGRLVLGRDMMAGELGHVTVDLHGIKCGCGNTGCLETVATDPAFARAVSKQEGRRLEVEEAVRLARDGKFDVTAPLRQTLEYLAVGIGAAINIFNPQAVLVCARMLDGHPDALEWLRQAVARRSLAPLLNNCQIIRAEGNTRQGAIASIIQHLTHALWPAID
jgi:N-acetylglucosamine repressor